MTRRAEKGTGTLGANAEARTLATLLAPLVAGMTTTRQQLLAWVQAAGLVALDAVFREEAATLAGPKGRHDSTRSHHHWGTVRFTGRFLLNVAVTVVASVIVTVQKSVPVQPPPLQPMKVLEFPAGSAVRVTTVPLG